MSCSTPSNQHMTLPPWLMDELLEEVLLRVLVRAALVCRRWCRLISGRGFRRQSASSTARPQCLASSTQTS
uniref:F-box domain-containing protein n=1 Tax=Arundo donax TaxID=35708 RepID=A0A0A8ZFV5_ARUDO